MDGSVAAPDMIWKTQLCSRRRVSFGEVEEHVVASRLWYVVGFDNVDSEVWISWILVTGKDFMEDVQFVAAMYTATLAQLPMASAFTGGVCVCMVMVQRLTYALSIVRWTSVEGL